MTDVLRPQLYDRLEAKLGPVRVSRPGEALVEKATTAWAAPRGRAAPRPGSRVLQWGETYTVCCPFCRDRSFRLSVNHSWASPDPRTGRERLWLAKCFHENCLAGQPNRLLLRHLVFGLGVLAPAPVRRVPPVAAAARGPAGLPAGFAPLHELPPGHRARQYVLERGHDPDRLGRDLGVGYCEWAPPPFAAATDRLVVPLVVNGGLAGWQARRLDDDAPAGRTPKWWTSPGTEKAALLYNHDAARGYPIVVVVEGVADAWAVGPCAVALLGHAMSPAQERLLAAGWAGGVAVMLLDNDGPARPAAQDQNRRCRDRLARHVPGGVVLATLPEGADPGGLSRSAVWALILSAAAAQGVGLPFARLRDVVPHGSGTHPPAAPPPGRDPAAVAARLLGLGAAGDARPDDLVARVDAAGMGGLYREVELPAEAAAVAMRRNGVGVDVGWLRELDFELGRCQALTRERIWASAGRRLNPESDADVAAAVRHLAGGGGPGVAAGQSPGRDRFVKLVEVYCDLRRAASTAAGLLLRVDPGTGRVHCDLDPLGAATGRFTCADPPLQSLPRELRGLVVAGPGHVLVGADFSQVELRVLAHLSQDPELLGALRRGIDLHRRTAAYALGVPEDAVTAAQRDGVARRSTSASSTARRRPGWPGNSAPTATGPRNCWPASSPATRACAGGSTRPAGRHSGTARSQPCTAGGGNSRGSGRGTRPCGTRRSAKRSTPSSRGRRPKSTSSPWPGCTAASTPPAG